MTIRPCGDSMLLVELEPKDLVRELKAVGGDLKALRLVLTGRERGPELWAVLAALPSARVQVEPSNCVAVSLSSTSAPATRCVHPPVYTPSFAPTSSLATVSRSSRRQ